MTDNGNDNVNSTSEVTFDVKLAARWSVWMPLENALV